jgi:hypothetical protein
MDPAAVFLVVQMIVCHADGACLGTVQQVKNQEECQAMITAAESKAASVIGECNEYPMTEFARFFPEAPSVDPGAPPLVVPDPSVQP